MEKLYELWDIYKNKIIALIGFAVFAITLFVFVYFYNTANASADIVEEKTIEKEGKSANNNDKTTIETSNTKIKVDIKGAVKNPGVYEMYLGNRVNDVIKKAGGISNNATTDDINLSMILYDEMVIIVSTKNSEAKKSIDNNASINNSNKTKTNNKETTKININTASLEQLITLTGIGESKAKSIIEYRNNKKFEKIEDIKNVSGIGDSLFEKIKNNITI